MSLPGLRDWIFSAKTFAAAMLALWVAFRLNLDRPYWAMATAYIVSQPLTGAMRSKAAYRFSGTILGAVAAVALVPNLVDAPALLSAALALWTGTCLYFALLDRTPRSYVFMLAGYTAAIIGFPSVDTPGGIWDTALARVEEITLGIACTTLVGTVVFPRPVAPVLTARIDAWLQHAADWSDTILAGRREDVAAAQGRQRLASDAQEIGMLASHLAFDTSNQQVATRPIALLQQRVLMLLPVLSGIGDRLAALPRHTELQPLLRRIAAWIREGAAAPQAEAVRIHAEVEALEPAIGPQSGWQEIMLTGLLARLHELGDLLHDIQVLRRQVATGNTRLPRLRMTQEGVPDQTRHRDHALALLSAAAAALAIGVICAFWIGSAWPEGAVAAEMAAVACSFFAAQDDPAPAILNFLYATVIGLAIDIAYLFAVLPRVNDFAMLVLALAPTFLIVGTLIAMPATYGFGMAVAANGATLLGLASTYSADFATFLNTGLAAIAGMAASVTVTRVVRSVGAEWAARRLLRANRATIAAVASPGRGAVDRAAFTGLMLDRLSLVASRLATFEKEAAAASMDALTALRVGLNVVDLQRDAAVLPGAAHSAVAAMLDGLARYFRQPDPLPPEDALRDRIDAAITAVIDAPGPRTRALLLELVGIRRALFPDAPDFSPAPLPPVLKAAA